jgi:hypothetical protein
MSPTDFQSVAFGHASYRERRPGRNLRSFRSVLGVAIFNAACGNIIGVTPGTLKLGTLNMLAMRGAFGIHKRRLRF